MSRVATIPIQRNLADAIQRSQQKLAATQLKLATGKKVDDYAGLGTETVRQLSARTLLARHDAHSAVAKRVSTTLSLYNANITNIDNVVSALKTEVMTAVGTGRAAGLQESIEHAFQDYRSALNASEGETPLFAGSRTDELPFRPQALSDLVGLPVTDAFANDDVRQAARVADGIDISYGAGASEVGADLYIAFQKLAESGPISDPPTATQMTALEETIDLIEAGLKTVRAVNGENGRRQAQVEALGNRAEERKLLLTEVIGQAEDADLGEVATELAHQETTLRASFSVFSKLATLSLTDYLR